MLFFAPKERSIQLFIGLQETEQSTNAGDFIVTISDINNRCVRLSAKTTDDISFVLDTDIQQPPFRVEIIHRKEIEHFENFKFAVWYMAKETKNKSRTLFDRLGKFFPGLAGN
ncbi:hypothetical protein CNR22_14010 [Sphingobacteriaceae bacterium]|nr:hypothetical protein CNR22_14010 [Sphingobacteriaceae bacterium]